jgi:cytochrome c oxidase subunit 4
MSDNQDKPHIVPYKTFLLVLAALLVFTFVSIAVTNYNLGPLTVLTALLLATAKTVLVLTYFMHLKWDVRMFAVLVTAVLMLIGVVIAITFLDYLFR